MWDKLVGTQVVKNLDEMRVLAQEVGDVLKPSDVLLLCGPLGSGKTAFVQSLADVLGVVEQITSPTYTVVAEYDIEGKSSIERMVHIDLYRLSDKDVSRESSVLEALLKNKRKNTVVLIEWAEKLGDKAPKEAKRIEFEYGEKENERKVKFIK